MRAYVNEAQAWPTATAGPAHQDAPRGSGQDAPHRPDTEPHTVPRGPAPPASPAPQSGRPHRARVLVVDDNADMRSYLSQLLRDEYEVLLAADGQEALEIAVAQPVELVLTDVMMPRLDGFGLVRALRADQRTARLPIVMLTARAGEEASVEGLHAGADDYLAKPFSARQLRARVRTGVELHTLREQVLTHTRTQLAQLASLAEAGLRLSAPLNPDEVLHTAGEVLLPHLADQVGHLPRRARP